MTIELTVVVGLLCSMLGVLCTLAAKKRSERKDAAEEGKADGVILTELGYIKSGIDDVKRKQERTDSQYVELITRVTAVEASTRQAHKRVDDIMAKGV